MRTVLWIGAVVLLGSLSAGSSLLALHLDMGRSRDRVVPSREHLPAPTTYPAELLWGSAADAHEFYRHQFLKNPGFGLTRLPLKDEHRLLRLENRLHRVRPIGLIGLEDRTDPVVYFGRNKDFALGSSTRPPQPAEREALQLLEGRDVVLRKVDGNHMLVGALYADRTCGTCHDVKVGQLLGALLYTFDRAEDPMVR